MKAMNFKQLKKGHKNYKKKKIKNKTQNTKKKPIIQGMHASY